MIFAGAIIIVTAWRRKARTPQKDTKIASSD
jgi:hypothetical protein